jgi:glycosyltransferase involved in cell wall biosynthesis
MRESRDADERFLRGKRILQVATLDSTISAFLTPLIDALTAEGANVEMAARCGNASRGLKARGYVLHCTPFARRGLSLSHLASLWRLWRLMRRGRYDAVHVHTPVAGVLGRVAARLARVPVVIHTAHGFYFHDRMPSIPRWALVLLEKVLGRTCTDFLFTVSREDHRTALRSGIIDSGRLRCLDSVGIDLQRFDAAEAAPVTREALQLPPGEPIIVFVGRVVEEKGILDLIHAVKLLKDDGACLKLLVVGDTLPSDRAAGIQGKVRRLVTDSDLLEDVRFLGFRADVPSILRLADLLVLPSYREGMPVTILEAMAASRPVVATDVRGCREEVVDGETGWIVPPADPSALADAIGKLLAEPERARAMGRAGRRRAEKEYDQARVISEQLSVYRDLLSRRTGQDPVRSRVESAR